jgi:hypothetical protein
MMSTRGASMGMTPLSLQGGVGPPDLEAWERRPRPTCQKPLRNEFHGVARSALSVGAGQEWSVYEGLGHPDHARRVDRTHRHAISSRYPPSISTAYSTIAVEHCFGNETVSERHMPILLKCLFSGPPSDLASPGQRCHIRAILIVQMRII